MNLKPLTLSSGVTWKIKSMFKVKKILENCIHWLTGKSSRVESKGITSLEKNKDMKCIWPHFPIHWHISNHHLKNILTYFYSMLKKNMGKKESFASFIVLVTVKSTMHSIWEYLSKQPIIYSLSQVRCRQFLLFSVF